MTSGIWTIFPVFAYYVPEHKCKSPVQLYCEANDCSIDLNLDLTFGITTGGCDMLDIDETSIATCLSSDNLVACLEEKVSTEKIS